MLKASIFILINKPALLVSLLSLLILLASVILEENSFYQHVPQ